MNVISRNFRSRSHLLAIGLVAGTWLVATPRLSAQILPIPPAPLVFSEWAPLPDATARHAIFEPLEGNDVDSWRFWTRFGYLLGWVRQSPLPLPLATTGDTKNKSLGAIGQSGTRVLVGNEGVGYGVISGMRMSMGGWIDPQQTAGIEANAFVSLRRSNVFTANSDDPNSPVLALPYVSKTPGTSGENAQLVAIPKISSGAITVAASLERWGMEVNALYSLWRRPNLDITLLGGLRYQDLLETLQLDSATTTPGTKTVLSLEDRFTTRNQFYGAQVGSRFFMQRDVVFLEVTDSLAVGSTHQVVDIRGVSTQSGPMGALTGSFPGGFYAQPSNIGRKTANPFTVIPSLEMKLGFQLTSRLRTYASYEILYWNQVVRPGDQIDRELNLSQSPLLGKTAGVLSGPASPAPFFHRTDFWAQGVNFGFEFKF